MGMRQLMNGNRCSGRAIVVEKFAPHFVETAKVVHVDQKNLSINQIGKAGTGVFQNIGDVLNDGAGLCANIQVGNAHRINLDALKGIVRPARTGARYEDEVSCPLEMRKASPWRRLTSDHSTFFTHCLCLVVKELKHQIFAADCLALEG